MTSSFTQRALNITFQLTDGQFDEGGNALFLENLRISAKISKAGGYDMGSLQASIYGMTESQMRQLSTLGNVPSAAAKKNSVTLQAGNVQTPDVFSTLFSGNIQDAYADFRGSPNVPFHILAQSGANASVVPTSALSYKSGTDVAVILKSVADTIGVKFENSGVNTQLASPYFAGTPREQALAAVLAAGCEWNGIENGVLAIWPRGKGKDSTVDIGPDSGLVGYPTFTSSGILIDMIIDTRITLGTKINLTTSLVPAQGLWYAYNIDVDAESQTPNGSWFMHVSASRSDLTVGGF